MARKIGVVTARFNSEVTEKFEAGALEYFAEMDEDIEVLNDNWRHSQHVSWDW